MTITATVIQKSEKRATVKIAATAAADTVTLTPKATITFGAAGTLTFLSSGGVNTIQRSSGSWLTDGVIPNSVISFTGTVSNNRTVNVISATATHLTVIETVVNEAVAGTPTGYSSILNSLGQAIGANWKVNIGKVVYSVGSANSISVNRNSINILTLLGHDEIDGFSFAEQNDQTIVVTFNGSGGTLILELLKVDGFGVPYQGQDLVV